VPEESAIFAGEKVVGQLGAYYRVGTYNVQADKGKLVWVAPLDFQGLVQWLVRRTSPGVVIVDAENPDAPAELRQRTPLRYIPSAFLNDNLTRHVWLKYGTELLLESTLQIDAEGNPRYLVTLGRPTIGWSGEKVTAVVIVDPATGAMERIPREQFDRLPAWVSRVYPPDLVILYNVWFGRYVHGWWNAQIARRDVHLPARDEVFGIILADGRFVWFVDHTSPSATDASMTGFTYTDSRTGAMVYYTSSGGEYNSFGAQQAVAGNPIIKQGRLIPTQPILYSCRPRAAMSWWEIAARRRPRRTPSHRSARSSATARRAVPARAPPARSTATSTRRGASGSPCASGTEFSPSSIPRDPTRCSPFPATG
jgi:hypothetical protein